MRLTVGLGMEVAGKNEYRDRKNATSRAFYWRHHNQSLERARKQREAPEYKALKRRKLLEKKVGVLTYYGGGKCTCVRCGFNNVKALSIDHINGRTPNEPSGRKLNGIGIYYWLIREEFPE